MDVNVKATNKTDCEKLTKQREGLNYTASEIREILQLPEYETSPVFDRTKLNDREKKNVRRFEDINTFGADVADCFEDLCEELHRLPTQAEYVKRGVELTEEWWMENSLRRNPQIRGLYFENEVATACEDRLKRGYLSLVNEVHTVALIKQMYPTAKIKTSDMLDLVMGVDIVMEYNRKRLYIHVFKNSYWGQKGFNNKESRGGMKHEDGHFVKYNRNFSGDICFCYDTTDTGTTELVNGIPLFTGDFIDWSIERAMKNPTLGENLATKNSKLEKLGDWLKTNFNKELTFN